MSKPVVIGRADDRANLEARAQDVADLLVGTPHNLSYAATTREMNNRFFCDALDDLAFECEGCGWWCHEEERNGDNLCDDCNNSDDV